VGGFLQSVGVSLLFVGVVNLGILGALSGLIEGPGPRLRPPRRARRPSSRPPGRVAWRGSPGHRCPALGTLFDLAEVDPYGRGGDYEGPSAKA
jgi:hypothetical protein